MKCWINLALLIALNGHAAVPANNNKLDMKSVQVNFREGELDAARTLLESFLKHQSGSATRDEKIFAYKYLGVIYAADSNTEAVAESYFYHVLQLAPNIELADMYVSKSIQSIFDKVKGDFLHTQEYRDHFDVFGNPRNTEKNQPPETATIPPKKTATVSESHNHAWVWWTVGTAVAAGLTFWIYESAQTTSGANHVTGNL